jgi:hypothetical protein
VWRTVADSAETIIRLPIAAPYRAVDPWMRMLSLLDDLEGAINARSAIAVPPPRGLEQELRRSVDRSPARSLARLKAVAGAVTSEAPALVAATSQPVTLPEHHAPPATTATQPLVPTGTASLVSHGATLPIIHEHAVPPAVPAAGPAMHSRAIDTASLHFDDGTDRILLVVSPISSFASLREVVVSLEAVHGMDAIRLRRMQRGTAWITLKYVGDRAFPVVVEAALAQFGAKITDSADRRYNIGLRTASENVAAQ